MVSGEIDARLLSLQNTYLTHLSDTKNTLMQTVLSASQRDLTSEERCSLKRISHNLAGSAKSYGFDKIGEAARKLENCLEQADEIQNKLPLLSAISSLYEVIGAAGNDRLLSNPSAEINLVSNNEPSSRNASVKSKILIADDDPYISQMLKKLFGDEIDVKIVENGSEVERTITEFRPNLLLLDDNLPGLTGIEIIERLHKAGAMKTLPVFMLTANKEPENVMRAISLGAVDYYTKPFEPMEFVKKIRLILERMKHTVLLIDDDPTIHEILSSRFQMSGLKVLSALNGKQALETLESNRASVIILDRMMPGLEGGAVLHQLSQNEKLKDIPVIMLTARNSQEGAHDWMKRGAADFMFKPFNPDEVVLRTFRILELETVE